MVLANDNGPKQVILSGSTSEDVAAGLFDGTYGSADETGRLFAEAAARAAADAQLGFGTALAHGLLERDPPHADLSLLCTAARAGHQSRLPTSGIRAMMVSDCSSARREKLPVERMAAACTPITKAAPTTAETICEIRRVRLGPRPRNKATVSIMAKAVESAAMAMRTP